MSQVNHIKKHKENIIARATIIKSIREFFWNQNFTEINAPTILRHPGLEPYLDPMSTEVQNEKGEAQKMFLHTSPEYTMKKSLAAGFENIFSLGPCYRNKESFGGHHNPEFTMIEWYRKGVSMEKIMDDCEELIRYVINQSCHCEKRSDACLPVGRKQSKDRHNLDCFTPFAMTVGEVRRVSMNDLWKELLNVNLNGFLTVEAMHQLNIDRGYSPIEGEPFEDLFFRIFLNEVEPKLRKMGAVIIHHYPKQMAALAKISKKDSRYAERFELYINGVEIANAFSELCDPIEQRSRFVEEQKKRKELGKEVFAIDEEFIASLEHIDSAAGIALGIDRLVMALLDCKNIDDVLILPMSSQ